MCAEAYGSTPEHCPGPASQSQLTKNQKKKLKKKKRKAAARGGGLEASQDTDSPAAHSSGPADSSTTEQSGRSHGNGADMSAESHGGRCVLGLGPHNFADAWSPTGVPI